MKADTYKSRFHDWDFKQVAKWKTKQIEDALQDTGIVRNKLKVNAAVANAKIATELEKTEQGGFAGWMWRVCGSLPEEERLLQSGTIDGSHMRSNTRTDWYEADGVHPTVGVTAALKEFKNVGWKFLGPTTLLSFMQAAGFCNHHKPDCAMYDACNKSYFEARAKMLGSVKIEGKSKVKQEPSKSSRQKRRSSSSTTTSSSAPKSKKTAGAGARKRRK